MTPIALMVGSNRIIPASGIIHPMGNADLEVKEEKALRRAIVRKALDSLRISLTEQKVFPLTEQDDVIKGKPTHP
jgi:betaine reductase